MLLANIFLSTLPPLLLMFRQSSKHSFSIPAIVFLALFVWTAFTAIILATIFLSNMGRYARTDGRRAGKIYLRPDGIHDHAVDKTLLLPWKSVRRIAQTRHNLYFLTSVGNSTGLWVTLSSFESPKKATRFIAAATALHQSGGNFAVLSPDVRAEFAPPA